MCSQKTRGTVFLIAPVTAVVVTTAAASF
jgi:hypothetical protein